MACKCVGGKYIFHQTCRLWNVPCVHGCGCLHLSSSTLDTRKTCCANGRLSSASDNFDEKLILSSNCGFSQKSSTYNNLVAMAATAVCNYSNTSGSTKRGHGPQSVFMNGRVHHYMKASSTTLQNCGFSYFIFDDGMAEWRNGGMAE